MSRPWLILTMPNDGVRLGSFPLTPEVVEEVAVFMVAGLAHRDAAGHEYWTVWTVRPDREVKRRAAAFREKYGRKPGLKKSKDY